MTTTHGSKPPQTEKASPSAHSLLQLGQPHFTDGETEAGQGGLQTAVARRSSSCGRGPPGAGESHSRLIGEAGTRTPAQGLPGVGGTAEAQAPPGLTEGSGGPRLLSVNRAQAPTISGGNYRFIDQPTRVSIYRCVGKRNVAVHALEHDSAVNRSEALTQATARMHLEHIMLSKRRQTQKATQRVMPSLRNIQDLPIQRQERDWLRKR
ncbi:uncharacterized protein [Symphalangus syndactylus]|uniref:uncharacterized protein isoform X2 n=1 Tax=Symphalangus syndactylus TaxID=9590 RepID=UPI0024410E0C|nr:uncharacterized protein LOC129466486 isoform X3 [Symphalangus syndactylus]